MAFLLLTTLAPQVESTTITARTFQNYSKNFRILLEGQTSSYTYRTQLHRAVGLCRTIQTPLIQLSCSLRRLYRATYRTDSLRIKCDNSLWTSSRLRWVFIYFSNKYSCKDSAISSSLVSGPSDKSIYNTLQRWTTGTLTFRYRTWAIGLRDSSSGCNELVCLGDWICFVCFLLSILSTSAPKFSSLLLCYSLVVHLELSFRRPQATCYNFSDRIS